MKDSEVTKTMITVWDDCYPNYIGHSIWLGVKGLLTISYLLGGDFVFVIESIRKFTLPLRLLQILNLDIEFSN